MSRRDARDIAFKLVFEYGFSKQENNDALEEYTAGMDADDLAFVKEVYFGVTSHYDELLEKISGNIEKFALDVMQKFQQEVKSIRMATYKVRGVIE